MDRNRALIAAGVDLRLRDSGLVIGLDYESQIVCDGSQGSVRLMLRCSTVALMFAAAAIWPSDQLTMHGG